ncbi:hypothetical protein B0181_09240 [Moraxella caviae]|uniref:Phage anti-repressor protein n=1 Tax=Moraxella caviae TaxID=34060 RepID=A0A1S9ZX37_9GAMM|nr:antA/AntB antirepressor family protein [Moraxella caviae]OOR88003.1 hypothetical protein B0181_09240 [Moraxella caviae]STZ14025.1 Phage anti-repressor protein [Moraxella caviae]STZ14497.1 Phage anti-repressor protein [Moraxella caviae]VEW11323.1 Phage anti-repressor protein [Moraxella caviae]VEW12839.1 Phage anti-repressor protein [Moraxella caviae]
MINIQQNKVKDEMVQTVNARHLHKNLGVKSRFNDWIKIRIHEYGFIQNVDYILVTEKIVTKTRGGNRKATNDYHLTLDMAKELAMVEKTEKGRQIRRYFIECEKRLNDDILSIGMQLERALLEKEHLERVLSNAGYVLNKGGRHLKPILLAKINKLQDELQPSLPFKEHIR